MRKTSVSESEKSQKTFRVFPIAVFQLQAVAMRGSSPVTAAGPRGIFTRFPSCVPHLFGLNVGRLIAFCQEKTLQVGPDLRRFPNG